MLIKVLLAALFVLMIAGAFRFRPIRDRGLLASRSTDGPRVRLMTWNIGYAEQEEDTRAHTKDLKAVAETILEQDPDAVALQELTGDEQLKILLGFLGKRYHGRIAKAEGADRVVAILVKDTDARFEDIAGDGKHFVSATFQKDERTVTFASVHADAFSAERRRVLTDSIVDWTGRMSEEMVFVAGDFNFEVNARDDSHLYTNNLKHDSEAYSSLLKFFRDLARDAGDTAINDRRIDYIFGPREGATLRRAEVLRGAAVGRMDHWPVVVEVGL